MSYNLASQAVERPKSVSWRFKGKRQIDNMPDDYEPPETLYGNFTNRNIKLFLGALIIGFLIYKYNKK